MHEGETSLANALPMEIRHKTLTEEVFQILSDAILTGAIKEGERLNETELAQKMGISRAPVREALAKLAKHGLAVQVPRKGTFVEKWNKRDLWEIATLRSVLEGLAARLASSNIEPADVRFLEDVIKRMDTADQEGDVRQLIDLDITFHSRIWECARHKQLQRTLEDLKLQIRLFMIVTRPSDVVAYPGQHQALLEAVCSHDPERAQRTAIEHVMTPTSLALQGVSDDEVWERIDGIATSGWPGENRR